MARLKEIDLESAVTKILEEYEQEVNVANADVVKAVVKAGSKKVRENARGDFGGTGKYASGWTSLVEEGRLSAQGTIYNSKVPGLPHLLEFGHAMRGGGRVSGKVHIKPVEDELERLFMEQLENKLK